MRDRRTEIRFGADQPVVVSMETSGPNKEIPGHIVEASKSGLRIITEVPIDKGALIKVKWEHTVLIGETRHCRQIGPAKFRIGLKISEVLGRGKLRTQQGAA